MTTFPSTDAACGRAAAVISTLEHELGRDVGEESRTLGRRQLRGLAEQADALLPANRHNI